MAKYEHLPIFKKAYDLTLYFEKIVRNFSRYHKYSVGAEIRELSREVLRLIRRANNAQDKVPLLLQNRERFFLAIATAVHTGCHREANWP